MVTIAPSRKPSQRGGLPGRPYSVAEVNRPHPFPLPHPPSLRYGAVRRGYRVEAKRRRKERQLISTALGEGRHPSSVALRRVDVAVPDNRDRDTRSLPTVNISQPPAVNPIS